MRILFCCFSSSARARLTAKRLAIHHAVAGSVAVTCIMATFLVAAAPVAAQISDAQNQAAALSRAFREAAAKVKPAVVTIIASRKVPDEMRELFGGQLPEANELEGREIGSGVVIGANGLVLTNNHVVRNADSIVIRTSDGSEYDVQEVKSDRMSDLAVLKIEPHSALPTVTLGDSDRLEIGDWVIAIGSPFDLEATVSAGIISAKGRSIPRIPRAQLIQTDAAINPGNSGGPLVSLQGAVVGINTAIATSSGGYQGVGFAIPSSKARWVVDQLRDRGEVQRAWLGIHIGELNAAAARDLNLPARSGIWVERVVPGSPAEAAELSSGDVIVEFGGRQVRSPGDLQAIVEQTPIGTAQQMFVMRDGERVALTVTVELFRPNFRQADEDGRTEP